MNVVVNELEPCKLQVFYSSDKSEVLDKMDAVVNVFKKAPVSGFRAGKAPVKVIKMKYKHQINESLKRAMLEDAFHNVVFDKHLSVLGQPQIEKVSLIDNNFECSMVLHVKPDIELSEYKGLTIPKPHTNVDVSDVAEQMMQDLRVRFGDVRQYDENDFVQMGDSLIVNYVGRIDGEIVNELTADGEMLTIGASRLVEFDQNLLGMKVDENRKFTMTIPVDGVPTFAGKMVEFDLTLVSGSRITPAPLDDSLAKMLHKETFEELKLAVSATAANKVVEQNKSKLVEALSNQLIANHEFVVPNFLVLPEAKQIAYMSKLDWDKMPDTDRKSLLDIATKNVKVSLILDKVRSEEPDAQLADQELMDAIKNTLITYSNGQVTAENVNEKMKTSFSQNQINVMAERYQNEHTLDYLLSVSNIVE